MLLNNIYYRARAKRTFRTCLHVNKMLLGITMGRQPICFIVRTGGEKKLGNNSFRQQAVFLTPIYKRMNINVYFNPVQTPIFHMPTLIHFRTNVYVVLRGEFSYTSRIFLH